MPNYPKPPIKLKHPVWERQKGESEEAFDAWLVYRDLGTKRTVKAVAADRKKGTSVLTAWCAQFHWVDRARTYDNHLDADRVKGARKEARKTGIDWERRRSKLMATEYTIALRLFKKCQEIIDSIVIISTAVASQVGQPDQLAPHDIVGGNRLDGSHGNRFGIGGNGLNGPVEPDNQPALPSPMDDATKLLALRVVKDSTVVLKDAASIAKDASALAWGTINAGLGDRLAASDDEGGKGSGGQPSTSTQPTHNDEASQ